MNRQQPSVDGFSNGYSSRRPGGPISGIGNTPRTVNIGGGVSPVSPSVPQPAVQPVEPPSDYRHAGMPEVKPPIMTPQQASLAPVPSTQQMPSTQQSDLAQSLQEIDDASPKELSRRQRRRQRRRDKRAAHPRRWLVTRIIAAVVLLLVLIGGGIAGFLAYKAIHATHSAFKGSILDIVQTTPLKTDSQGRSNFLILGTSEDDPGHQGSNLTDSMLVLSIDQAKKNAYLFSVPRDLYVKYGMACDAGYAGKINDYFSCSNTGTDTAAEQDRLSKTQAFVGNILGMDIQYGVHVNYTVVRDTINAIGGSIQVNIQGDDGSGPSSDLGIMDSNFDWKCGASYSQRIKNCPPDGHFIEYTPGVHTLDAEHALYLAQARGDVAPTYGLAQSNFDRERNQQKIIVAIKDKATSAGVLTNIGDVSNLIDALGNNLRTNIQTKEIQTIMKFADSIKDSDIHNLDFYSSDNRIMTTETIPGAGSVVIPAAGEFDYSDLQAYIAKSLSSNPVVAEAANIAVFNGSDTAGAAQTVADTLTGKGYTISDIDNAPSGSYTPIEIYQVTSDKTATASALAKLYGVTIKTTTAPVTVPTGTDFVIIVGQAPGSSSTSN